MELFTLRRKKDGALPEVNFTSNDGGDFCHSVEVSLWFTKPRHLDSLWVVPKEDIAERAKTSTEWYNACWDTPNHSEKVEDLEVLNVKDLLTK
jgi:hypothetical protein